MKIDNVFSKQILQIVLFRKRSSLRRFSINWIRAFLPTRDCNISVEFKSCLTEFIYQYVRIWNKTVLFWEYRVVLNFFTRVFVHTLNQRVLTCKLVAQLDEIFHHPDNRNIAQQCASPPVWYLQTWSEESRPGLPIPSRPLEALFLFVYNPPLSLLLLTIIYCIYLNLLSIFNSNL